MLDERPDPEHGYLASNRPETRADKQAARINPVARGRNRLVCNAGAFLRVKKRGSADPSRGDQANNIVGRNLHKRRIQMNENRKSRSLVSFENLVAAAVLDCVEDESNAPVEIAVKLLRN